MKDKEKKPSELVAQSASVNGVVVDTSQTQNITAKMTMQDMKSLWYEVNGEPNNTKSVNKSFAKKKRMAELLRSSYFRLSMEEKRLLDKGYSLKEITEQFGILPHLGQRGLNVGACGDSLEFRIPVDGGRPLEGGKWKLHRANFCHDRLCPLCMARRSLKVYSQLNQVMNYMDAEQYEYLFLTVTIPNCQGELLDKVVDKLLKAFSKMLSFKKMKSLVKGYFRSLEVTFNHNSWSKSYMTFHPHIHAILAVPKNYFGKSYIKHDEWLRMWQKAYGNDDIQFVNIKKIYAAKEEMEQAAAEMSVALSKAIAETGKYSVKASDYLFSKDDALTDFAVMHLSRALHGKRLFAMGGVFAEASKALNLEDVMKSDSDLLHINADDVINPELAYYVVKFRWGGKFYESVSHAIINPAE